MLRTIAYLFFAIVISCPGYADDTLTTQDIDRLAKDIEIKVIEWRRDIHQHPELGNREVRTGKLITAHLQKLGLDVQYPVGKTGVVALLKGGKPGPVVALRADMDALPVVEAVDLPFASKAKGEYEGKEVGVMHACGHDTHVAILMGIAEMFAKVKDQIPGTVKFIFQPAEEGPPRGEEGGAALMIKEGALENPKPNAIFGLHVTAFMNTGTIGYRAGPMMASADILRIKVKGRQTHGSAPWSGVDPIVTASQIVLGLQTIVSRQINITSEPAVVTIGSIHGGNRFNIIPDEVELVGTIRTFNEGMRDDIHKRIKNTAEMIAASQGASAQVEIEKPYAVTINDEELTALMVPTLKRIASDANVKVIPKATGAEDFAFYLQKIPGLFYFVGITPPGTDMTKVAVNHSPKFFVDESGLLLGIRSLAALAVDYLQMGK